MLWYSTPHHHREAKIKVLGLNGPGNVKLLYERAGEGEVLRAGVVGREIAGDGGDAWGEV